MRLELATYPVSDVRLVEGPERSMYREGVLAVNRQALCELLRQDPRLAEVSVDVASPGEAVRVAPVHDVIEPRIKAQGPGMVFPGVAGRPLTTVGTGRTNRMSGVAVVECAPLPGWGGTPGRDRHPGFYLDTQGPAAVAPYDGLVLVCVLAVPREDLSLRDRSEAAWTAALRVALHLAETTLEAAPAQVETFELTPVRAELPRIVYLPHYNSPQHYGGRPDAFGLSIYGNTSLTLPWWLHPNEYLDGAVARLGTWVHQNQPQVLDLARAHGDSLAFAGIIAQRTRWTSEAEKQLTAQQTAKMAKMVGATGALVTWDYGGNDNVEVAYTLEACEALGIKTVFLTHEQGPPPTSAGTMIFLPAAADAVVSTGTLLLTEVTKPARIIGFDDGRGPLDFAVSGTREVFGVDDRYGLRNLSIEEY